MSSEDLQQKAKSFFQRPEGKTGMVFIAFILAALGWGLYLLLPFLITLLTNTLTLMLLAGAITLLVFIATDKRVRLLASYSFKLVMRWLTGLLIEIDPIGILRGYVLDLRKRLEEMDKSLGALDGQRRKLERIIAENEENRKHSLELAAMANKRPDTKAVFVLQARKAGRLEKSNMTLQALLNKMVMLAKVLKKMRETSTFLIDDIESEVQVKAQERAAIQASYGAFTAAKRIIQGDADQKELFDQTMERLAEDYAMKVGEIEQFMEVSEGFIKSVDLENGIYELSALEQLQEWEKKTDQLLLGDPTKRDSVPGLPAANLRVDASPPQAEEESPNSFSELFDSPSKGQQSKH